jgi:type IV pilus assembly protein PilA
MPFSPVRRVCRGFTAVELAAVIAVTVFVGALGYSAWRTYTVRRQVAEGVAAVGAVRDAVVRAFRSNGEVPPSLTEAGIVPFASGRLVESITVENGRIDVVYGGQADEAIVGRRLSLTPYETATSEIIWLCGNEIPEPGLHPLGFVGGGRQALQVTTTIEPRYLPRPCR